MENIIKKELPGGYVLIHAAPGYVLMSLALNRIVSEAAIKAEYETQFVAILAK